MRALTGDRESLAVTVHRHGVKREAWGGTAADSRRRVNIEDRVPAAMQAYVQPAAPIRPAMQGGAAVSG